MNNKRKSVPIFVPEEIKKIVELNKGIGKNELGKSLINLLEDSPRYRKLKEVRRQIIEQLDIESVSFEDVLSPKTKPNRVKLDNGLNLVNKQFCQERQNEGKSHSEISHPMESLNDNTQKEEKVSSDSLI